MNDATTPGDVPPISDDVTVLHSMGYAQELKRRMSLFSNFAISFSIICITAGILPSFQLAYSAGGGASVGIGWILASLFALVVACSMGQIASAYPERPAASIRKRIEEPFGWMKATAGLRKTRHRGLGRVGWIVTLTATAANLVRLPKLLSGPA